MKTETTGRAGPPEAFDRLMSELDGLPEVLAARPAVIRDIPPLGIGGVSLYIVQTYRRIGEGDTVFLECVNQQGTVRLILPASVADAIARQRDQLTGKSRSRAARSVAEARKARGELPAFMKKAARTGRRS